MRWIVMSLLVANIGWAAWRWLLPPAPGPAGELMPAPGVVRLQMPHEPGATPVEPEALAETAQAVAPTSKGLEATPAQDSGPAAATATPAPVPEPVAALLCWATPWSAREDLLAEWGRQAPQAFRQSRDVAAGETWLVYLPAKGGREQMLERLRSLKGLKIESAFINAGEQMGGISLGLFSRKESAEKRLAEARALGVQDAVVKSRVRQRAEHRLTQNNAVAPGQDWQTHACADVAPGNKPL